MTGGPMASRAGVTGPSGGVRSRVVRTSGSSYLQIIPKGVVVMDSNDGQVTQEAFGLAVGISQQAVSSLVQREILAPNGTFSEWVAAYCAHLRGVAAERAACGDLDLATQRARVAKEAADRIAMQNHERRRELMPTPLLLQLLSKASFRIAQCIGTIPPGIQAALPALPPDVLRAVTEQVARARQTVQDLRRIDLFQNAEGIDSDEEAEPEESEPVGTVGTET